MNGVIKTLNSLELQFFSHPIVKYLRSGLVILTESKAKIEELNSKVFWYHGNLVHTLILRI